MSLEPVATRHPPPNLSFHFPDLCQILSSTWTKTQSPEFGVLNWLPIRGLRDSQWWSSYWTALLLACINHVLMMNVWETSAKFYRSLHYLKKGFFYKSEFFTGIWWRHFCFFHPRNDNQNDSDGCLWKGHLYGGLLESIGLFYSFCWLFGVFSSNWQLQSDSHSDYSSSSASKGNQ